MRSSPPSISLYESSLQFGLKCFFRSCVRRPWSLQLILLTRRGHANFYHPIILHFKGFLWHTYFRLVFCLHRADPLSWLRARFKRAPYQLTGLVNVLKKAFNNVCHHKKSITKEDESEELTFPNHFFLLLMEWFILKLSVDMMFLRKAFESKKKNLRRLCHGNLNDHFIELHIHLEYLQWKRNLRRKKAPTDLITGIISKRRRRKAMKEKKRKSNQKNYKRKSACSKVEKKLTPQTKNVHCLKLEKNQ